MRAVLHDEEVADATIACLFARAVLRRDSRALLATGNMVGVTKTADLAARIQHVLELLHGELTPDFASGLEALALTLDTFDDFHFDEEDPRAQ